MKVLVTGGAGFIGSHVVDRMVAEGHYVRAIDNLSSGKLENIANHLKSGNIDFVKGDIRNAETVKQCVYGVEAIVHLAAITSVPFSFENPKLTHETNAAATLNLLNAAAEARVRKFILTSSCAVYGEPKYLPINEKHPTNPISPYAESKLKAEQHCLNFIKKQLLKGVALRLFNVYDPRQGLNDYSGVITQFLDRSKKKLPLTIHGDGLQTRDFVHVSDAVEAILSAIENEQAGGEIFNIGSGKPTSINKLAQTVSELSGVNLKVLHDTPRLGDIKHSYADIIKAEKILGYRPRVSLRDGLRTLLTENS